jgi:hypothetical protein
MQTLNTVYVWGTINNMFLVPTKMDYECIDEMCISICQYTCRMYRPRTEKKLAPFMLNLLHNVSRANFWDVSILCTVEL